MGQHKKPNDTTLSMKKIALGTTVGLGAVVVPAATAGTASAATDSQWEAVAIPEAGGDWTINHSGDGMSVGGLQFQNASWQDALAYLRSQGIDTSSFPPSLYQGMSNVPTKAQQMLAGEALLHIQGSGAWANGNGAGLGASMFDGGSVPATVASSGLLKGTRWDTGATGTGPVVTPPPAPKPKPHRHGHGHGHGWGHWKHHGRPATAGDTYTVRSGDTLYGITKRATGNAAEDNWKPLYAANKAVIGPDPDLIFPGQVLKLPWATADADPATGSNDTPPPPPPPPVSTGDYVAPVPGAVIQAFHNSDAMYGLGYHTGVDFAAPMGTPVKAVHSGVVVSINASGSAYGNHVVVKHADGVYTLSAHLSSINVKVGDAVATGQVIALSGSTGNSSGPHLHFELRNDPTQYAEGVFSDPIAWLKSHGVSF